MISSAKTICSQTSMSDFAAYAAFSHRSMKLSPLRRTLDPEENRCASRALRVSVDAPLLRPPSATLDRGGTEVFATTETSCDLSDLLASLPGCQGCKGPQTPGSKLAGAACSPVGHAQPTVYGRPQVDVRPHQRVDLQDSKLRLTSCHAHTSWVKLAPQRQSGRPIVRGQT